MGQGAQFELRHLPKSEPFQAGHHFHQGLPGKADGGKDSDILADPNFDCLASNNAAGLLICSDPDLAAAKMEFNSKVRRPARQVDRRRSRESARWIPSVGARERDRNCDLADKDNVPLEELSSSEACLANYFKQKTAEIAAAKGDPKRIFARPLFSPLPRCQCRRSLRRAAPCRQYLREFSVGETRVRDRQRIHHNERARHRRDRNERAHSLQRVQPNCIGLHRIMLGCEIGESQTGAGKPGQFDTGPPCEHPEIVRVSEDGQRQLALRNGRAPAC